MYTKTSQFYDRIYAFKDTEVEAQALLALIDRRLHTGGNRLLDVACGTGRLVPFLQPRFAVEGLDLDPGMLAVARQKFPDVPFHQADMVDFDLGRQFDLIVNLFSSIGYVRTVENLNRAMASMARHLRPGGLLLVEPWFTPATWHPGSVHAVYVNDPELKIARINTSQVDGRLSWMDLHYLVGTPQGVEHFIERHELGLFEVDEMLAAFTAAGLQVEYDPQGLSGRGLYIGMA